MALFINGTGQSSFAMNGVDIDNLYVDKVLVWSSTNNKPVITRIGSSSIIITEGDTYIDQGATAFDLEDGDITADIVTVDPVDTNTVGNYTITYNVTDSGGLAADEVTRAVEVQSSAVSEIPPVYRMTEAIVDSGAGDNTRYRLFDSSGSTTTNDGILNNWADTNWDPTGTGAYPIDGTIVMTNGRKIRIPYIAPQNEVKGFTYIYDVDKDNSYKMVAIHQKGDGTCDVWRGSNSNGTSYPLNLAVANTGLLYNPSAGETEVTEALNYEIIPIVPSCTIVMDKYNFGAGDTATVTFEFNTIPTGFTLGDITADNGVMSNLTQDPGSFWIYTATFTPNENLSSETNSITVSGSAGEYTDQWGNASNTDNYSDNYTIGTEPSTDYWGSWGTITDSGAGSYNFTANGDAMDLEVLVTSGNSLRPTTTNNLAINMVAGTANTLEFDAVIIGSCRVRAVYGNAGGSLVYVDHYITAGHNSIPISEAVATDNLEFNIYFDATSIFDIQLTNTKLLEV